ncbi:hypothetical protein DYB32_010872, partial [Aphanomyces invadans]
NRVVEIGRPSQTRAVGSGPSEAAYNLKRGTIPTGTSGTTAATLAEYVENREQRAIMAWRLGDYVLAKCHSSDEYFAGHILDIDDGDDGKTDCHHDSTSTLGAAPRGRSVSILFDDLTLDKHVPLENIQTILGQDFDMELQFVPMEGSFASEPGGLSTAEIAVYSKTSSGQSEALRDAADQTLRRMHATYMKMKQIGTRQSSNNDLDGPPPPDLDQKLHDKVAPAKCQPCDPTADLFEQYVELAKVHDLVYPGAKVLSIIVHDLELGVSNHGYIVGINSNRTVFVEYDNGEVDSSVPSVFLRKGATRRLADIVTTIATADSSSREAGAFLMSLDIHQTFGTSRRNLGRAHGGGVQAWGRRKKGSTLTIG